MKKVCSILFIVLSVTVFWIFNPFISDANSVEIQMFCTHNGDVFGTVLPWEQTCEQLHDSLPGYKDHPGGDPTACFIGNLPISPDL